MSLSRVGFLPIPPGGEPGFDHADVHRPSGRMYVAHTGADRVDVLDCRARTFLRSLPDLPGVAGVLITGAMMAMSMRRGEGSEHMGRLGMVLGGCVLVATAGPLINFVFVGS